jgi:hypothetical protein
MLFANRHDTKAVTAFVWAVKESQLFDRPPLAPFAREAARLAGLLAFPPFAPMVAICSRMISSLFFIGSKAAFLFNTARAIS